MVTPFNTKYLVSQPETQEQVQARIDALTPQQFAECLVAHLYASASVGVVSFVSGEPTPNGRSHLALARRLSREHGISVTGNNAQYLLAFVNAKSEARTGSISS